MRSLCVAVLTGCLVGPRYHAPPAPVPVAASFKNGWKLAHPADAIPRGRWWTIFHDSELDALEAQVDIRNQTIAQAVARYTNARAQVRAAIARYYPTISTAPTAIAFRSSGNAVATGTQGSVASGTTAGGGRNELYILPLDVSWQPDLFGRVRYQVRESAYNAQISAADLENTRLLVQSLLAQMFFELRGQDALVEILEATVKADQEIVDVTRQRFGVGLAQEVALVQAQLTLQVARVQAASAAILRDTFENAIATLVGKPATDFKLPHRALLATPPAVPIGTPSQLLERRPDVAAAERQMAAANAAIGLARTAYFPLISLTGTQCSSVAQPGACVGLISTSLSNLFTWPSRVWAVGANALEILFDGGERRANLDAAWARYDEAVATYRQTVLAAFEQVEDDLAQARGLAGESELQRAAVGLAQRSFELERDRYQHGLDPYIDLAIQQTALLSAQQTMTALQIQGITATIALIQALGGGWDRSELPPP